MCVLLQCYLNRDISVAIANGINELEGQLGLAPGSELAVLINRAHIYSKVLWSEQTRAPQRPEIISVQGMKKYFNKVALCKTRPKVVILYFLRN